VKLWPRRLAAPIIFHGRVPEAMQVWGLRFRLNRLQWRLTHRKSKTLRRKTWQKPSRRQEGCEGEIRKRLARQREGLAAPLL
jgi:hypothetical protein